MQTQIPIYRAKKIDSDEYVEGYLINNKEIEVSEWTGIEWIVYIREIDPSTLAIHFPDMVDKNGEKIFASLNDNCIGSSIVDRTTEDGRIYDSIDVEFQYINHLDVNLHDYDTPELTLEVVGIKKC